MEKKNSWFSDFHIFIKTDSNIQKEKIVYVKLSFMKLAWLVSDSSADFYFHYVLHSLV